MKNHISIIINYHKRWIKRFHFYPQIIFCILLINNIDVKGSKDFIFGSTVIILKFPNRAYIGADSKWNTNGISNPTPVSKIHIFEKIAFTSVGQVEMGKMFNAFDTAREASKRDSTLSNIVDTFVLLAKEKITRKLQLSKRQSPKSFVTNFLRRKFIIQSAIIGLENDTVRVFYRSFSADTSCTGDIIINTVSFNCPGDCKNGSTRLYLGHIDSLTKFTTTTNMGEFFRENGIIEGIRKLIRIECVASPNRVGEPIHILLFDKNGPQWIGEKPQYNSPHW